MGEKRKKDIIMDESSELQTSLSFLTADELLSIPNDTAKKISDYVCECSNSKDQFSTDLEKKTVELGWYSFL